MTSVEGISAQTTHIHRHSKNKNDINVLFNDYEIPSRHHLVKYNKKLYLHY